MGRMADVKTEGNVVWDRKLCFFLSLVKYCFGLTGVVVSSPGSSEDRSGNDYFSLGDALPAFSLLTSDEERERKAETTTPGTYHVIMVPDSFSSLPEYVDDADKSKSTVTESVYSVTSSPVSVIKPETDATDDPNVVIVKTFEDVTRRSSSTGRTSRVSPTSEISDPFCSLSLSPIMDSFPSPVLDEEHGSSSFLLDSCMDHQARQRQQDSTLLPISDMLSGSNCSLMTVSWMIRTDLTAMA